MCEFKKEKGFLLLIATIIVFVVVSGFIFRYQVISTVANAIVINRLTGEKQIINPNGEVVIVEEFGEKEGPKLTSMDITSPIMNMECKIKWRNGRLYYIADLSLPESTYLESTKYPNNAHINIDLLDKDGYLISTIPINLKEFVSYPIQGTKRNLTKNDSIPFKRSEFEAINSWDISWGHIKE